MDELSLLRVLYPERFSYAIVHDGAEPQQAAKVSLGPLHATAAADPADADEVETSDTGTYLAAASQKRVKEDDVELELVRKLARMELRSPENNNVSRRRALQALVKRTNARVLVSPDYASEQAGVDKNGYMHQTQEVQWQRQQVNAIERLTIISPMTASCIRTLKNQVMRDGVKFMRGNVELVPSAEFAEYTHSRLHPFAFQCIDAVLQIGIIPIVYELDPITGQRWPYVPALGTYTIKMHRVRGASRYRFFWIDENVAQEAWRKQVIRTRDGVDGIQWVPRPACNPVNCSRDGMDGGGIEDPTVEILHNIGYDLASDGSVTSKCASVLAVVLDRIRSQRNRLIAETLSAMPPIATEYDHNAEARQTRNLQQGAYISAVNAPASTEVAGDGVTESLLQQRRFIRDEASQRGMASLLRQYEAMGRDAEEEFEIPRSAYASDVSGTAVSLADALTSTGVPAPWSNQYNVTSMRRMVNLPQARQASDHINFMEHLDNQICSVFGVPSTFLQGTAIRAGTELVTDRLTQEVDALRKLISDILTRVYNDIFLLDDAEQLSATVQRRNLKNQRRHVTEETINSESALLTEEDLYVGEAIRRVRVTFAKPPAGSVDELFKMFALGGLDQHSLCVELARRNGFDTSQMCKIEEEIPLAQRRFLIKELADFAKFDEQRKRALKKDKDKKRATNSEATAVAEALAAGEDEGKQVGLEGDEGEPDDNDDADEGEDEGRTITVRTYKRKIKKRRTAPAPPKKLDEDDDDEEEEK